MISKDLRSNSCLHYVIRHREIAKTALSTRTQCFCSKKDNELPTHAHDRSQWRPSVDLSRFATPQSRLNNPRCHDEKGLTMLTIKILLSIKIGKVICTWVMTFSIILDVNFHLNVTSNLHFSQFRDYSCLMFEHFLSPTLCHHQCHW